MTSPLWRDLRIKKSHKLFQGGDTLKEAIRPVWRKKMYLHQIEAFNISWTFTQQPGQNLSFVSQRWRFSWRVRLHSEPMTYKSDKEIDGKDSKLCLELGFSVEVTLWQIWPLIKKAKFAAFYDWRCIRGWEHLVDNTWRSVNLSKAISLLKYEGRSSWKQKIINSGWPFSVFLWTWFIELSLLHGMIHCNVESTPHFYYWQLNWGT